MCNRKKSKKMGIWDRLKTAEVFEKGQYLPPGGKYLVEIKKVLEKDTRSSGKAFIVELEIVESNHPDVKVGSKYSWFQSMRDLDVAMPAIKEWLAAVSGINPRDRVRVKNELDGKIVAVIEAAIEDNVLEGERVWCETFSKKTKKNLDFTCHVWSPHFAE